MGDTTCIHKDKIEGISKDKNLGTCEFCGQVREYDTAGYNPPKIIKLGRINGQIVLPRAVEKLDLPTQELNEIGGQRQPAIGDMSHPPAEPKTGPAKTRVKPEAAAKPEAAMEPPDEPVVEPESKAGQDGPESGTFVVTIGKNRGLYDDTANDKKSELEPASETEAKAEPAAVPEAAQEPVASIPPKSKVSCKGCEFYRINGPDKWCASRICPRRHPSSMRPKYRTEEVSSESGKNVPPVKRPIHSDEFYEEHKEEIIEGYHSSLTIIEFFRMWHISATRWGQLKKQWQIAPKGQRNRYTANTHQKSTAQESETPIQIPEREVWPSQIVLPKFPAFDNSWSFIIQEKWLETYLELRKLEKARS